MGLVGAVCAWLRSCYNRPVLKMPALAQDACPSTSFPTTQVVDKDLMDMLVDVWVPSADANVALN